MDIYNSLGGRHNAGNKKQWLEDFVMKFTFTTFLSTPHNLNATRFSPGGRFQSTNYHLVTVSMEC